MKKRDFWTREKMLIEAKKYKSRSSFSLKNPSAYGWCVKYKELDNVCSHMSKINNSYNTPEFQEWLENEVYKLKTRKAFFLVHMSIFESISANKKNPLNKILDKLERSYHCTSSIGEESLRFFLNNVFNTNFIKIKPIDLINPKTGKQLELDGLCLKSKIAFEHNSRWHINQKRDMYKLLYCLENNIKLINTEDILNEIKWKDIKDVKLYVFQRIIDSGIKINKSKVLNSHFIWQINTLNSKWTIDNLTELAKPYKRLKDFAANHSNAYQAIRRRKWYYLLDHLSHGK